MSKVTRKGKWVVTENNPAQLGRVLSVHRSYLAAREAATRAGGIVEYATVVAAVQAGASYTSAVQTACGGDVRAARVVVEVQS